MTLDLTISPLTRSDAAAVATLMRKSFRATYPEFEELHTAEADLRFVRDHLLPGHTVEGAFVAGELAGFIAYDQNQIDQLYLAPSHLRQGIGSALLGRAKSARDRLDLWTFAQNSGARAFYKARGFAEIASTNGNNEHGQPDVKLRWSRA